MKATSPGGTLKTMPECFIEVGEEETIFMDILPDISDSKSAHYANENSIARTAPFTIFGYGEVRTISWSCHFVVQKKGDPERYLRYIRLFQSACYPRNQQGSPPPLCKIKCGGLLSSDTLCVVLKNYSIKYDTNVPWDEKYYIPYKLDIDLQFEVVYNQSEIPISDDIASDLLL